VILGCALQLPAAAGVPILGWGHNYYGQSTPPAAATNIVALGAGSQHALALRADGTLLRWGVEIVTDPKAGGAGRFYRVRALFAPAPRMGSVSWGGGAMSFSVPTVPGPVYVVQYKEYLGDPV
jgi:hypothetical protein